MSCAERFRGGAGLALLAVLCCAAVRSDAVPRRLSRMDALPRITLWAWERPEDLRAVDAQQMAIACLDRTLTIGLVVTDQARRDPVIFPAHATRIAVVRIETQRGAVLNEFNRDAAVAAILPGAREPGIAALQIDFDATRSQRPFYRALLQQLRAKMPPALPLSITALASWCSWDRWLREVPVDEAVPMMFRMEPDHRKAPPDVSDFAIREPLCEGSYGVSTTEPWPRDLAGKRVYVFSDNGWRRDSPAKVEEELR
ncbi:MAG TPA: DUF3142 domain-containing protein [Acidobacteriaceae bacterium]|nr:DUF3142 domain-containing protein [Acidobacteriaceae bacterium]